MSGHEVPVKDVYMLIAHSWFGGGPKAQAMPLRRWQRIRGKRIRISDRRSMHIQDVVNELESALMQIDKLQTTVATCLHVIKELTK